MADKSQAFLSMQYQEGHGKVILHTENSLVDPLDQHVELMH